MGFTFDRALGGDGAAVRHGYITALLWQEAVAEASKTITLLQQWMVLYTRVSRGK